MPSDAAELPIAQVAHEVLELEPSVLLSGPRSIELGNSFTDPAVRANFAPLERTQPLRLYRLHDVTLDASLMLLLRGRRPITETRYMVNQDEYAYLLGKPLHAIEHDPADHYVVGCNRAWHNYYHWLIQAVPAIDWSLRESTHRRPTLALWSLQPWQEETLALLGHQNIRRLVLHISGTYHFPSAEFSDFLGERMPGTISRAAMTTFRRMSENVPWPAGTADEIYIARTDVQNRVADNEAELIELLRGQGVRIIVPGALTVAQQIAAFRAARLVIGLHGAGLSNLVFCRSGSFVYEMLPRHYPNNAFNRVAQAAGLNYWADLFDGDGEGEGDGAAHDRRWRIDLDVIAARLAAIRDQMAATPRMESAMGFLRRTQVAQPDNSAPPVEPAEPVAPPEIVSEPARPRLLAQFWRRLFGRRSDQPDQ